MLPQIAQLQFRTGIEEDSPKMGKSFLFDFKKGDFVLKDGRLVEAFDFQALIVWIEKILRTERYRYKVYAREDKNEYGVVLEDLIVGNNFPHAFVEAELKREISQALIKHPMIQSLSDWNIDKKNPVLKISFKVNLIDGNTFIHEASLLKSNFPSCSYKNNTWSMVAHLTWGKVSNNTWEQLRAI